MKIISHRGNIRGPEPERENEPSYIDEAIALGFDVEIDIRYIGPLPGSLPEVGGAFYLGHNTPDYLVDVKWLRTRKDTLWIHCKNLDAAYELMRADLELRCFCSISDPFCFITQDFLWLNDLEVEPKDNCIVPLLSTDDLKGYRFMGKPWGVCTDYPMEIK